MVDGDRGREEEGCFSAPSRIARVESYPWTSWPEWSGLWSELANCSRDRSFFLSKEWVESGLEVFGASSKPDLLVFRDDQGNRQDAVGICLVGSRRERRGPVVVQRKYLNTTGEDEADEACIEYNTTLSRSGWQLPVAKAFWAYLDGLSWDEFEAPGMMAGDSLQALIAARPEQVTAERRDMRSHFVDLRALDRSPEAYLMALSRNTRAQIRRSVRLFEREGPLVVRAASNVAEAVSILNELVDLHQSYWGARGEPGAFASPRFLDFHRCLIERAFHRGRIQMLRITAGDQTFAALYNFIFEGKVHYYQSGLRRSGDKRLKPGLVAHYCAIAHSLKAGLIEYDFLAGEDRYKQSLSTSSRELAWIVFQQPRLGLKALALLRRVRRRLKRRLIPPR